MYFNLYEPHYETEIGICAIIIVVGHANSNNYYDTDCTRC